MEAISKSASFDALDFAKRTIRHEADALLRLASQLDADFLSAIEMLRACRGAVVVTGMGKAGLIGNKISATFCSTGTRSHFLHPAEAIHGDLGRVASDDCVLALSMSGETEELTRLVPSLKKMTSGIISITGRKTNTLARNSDVVIELGNLKEVGVDALAPSTSTTAMLAIGDALALTLSEQRGFRSHDFVRFHPGGSLGRKLTKVQEIMRPLSECRIANPNHTVRETFVTLRRPGRRTGAVMIVETGKLVGIFTDSDLARLLESEPDSLLTARVRDVMTCDPLKIETDSMMPSAVQILAENQISELPVVDSDNQLVGMIDITDIIDWVPSHRPEVESAELKPKLVPFPSAPHERESP